MIFCDIMSQDNGNLIPTSKSFSPKPTGSISRHHDIHQSMLEMDLTCTLLSCVSVSFPIIISVVICLSCFSFFVPSALHRSCNSHQTFLLSDCYIKPQLSLSLFLLYTSFPHLFSALHICQLSLPSTVRKGSAVEINKKWRIENEKCSWIQNSVCGWMIQ